MKLFYLKVDLKKHFWKNPRWQKVFSVHVDQFGIQNLFMNPFLNGDIQLILLRDFPYFEKRKIYETVLLKSGPKKAFFKKSEMTESFFYPWTLQQYIIFSPQTPFSWRIKAYTFVHFGKNPKFAQENAFFLFFLDTMSYFFLNIINIRPMTDRKKPFPMSVVPIWGQGKG